MRKRKGGFAYFTKRSGVFLQSWLKLLTFLGGLFFPEMLWVALVTGIIKLANDFSVACRANGLCAFGSCRLMWNKVLILITLLNFC